MLREYTINGATFLLTEEEAEARGGTLLNREPKQEPVGKKQQPDVKNKALTPQVK